MKEETKELPLDMAASITGWTVERLRNHIKAGILKGRRVQKNWYVDVYGTKPVFVIDTKEVPNAN